MSGMDDRWRTTVPGPAPPMLGVSWGQHDQLTLITRIGIVGLVIAGLMATLGLPPVDIHGPLHGLGIMDPLCGGTRAARLTAQGHLVEAWRYNPLGVLAVGAAGAAAVRSALGLTTGRWLTFEIGWTARRARWAVLLLVVVLVVLEVRQQGRADLLLRPY